LRSAEAMSSSSSRTSGHHSSVPTSTVTDMPSSVAGATSGTVASRLPYSPMSSDQADSPMPFAGFHRPPLPSSQPPRLSSIADVSVSQPSSGVSRSTFEHPGRLPHHPSSLAAAMMDAQQYHQHQQQHQNHHHPHHQFHMQIAARLQQRFAATAAAAAAAAVGGGMPYNQAVAAAACGLLGPTSAANPSHMPSVPPSSNGVVSAGHLLSYLYARQQQHRQQQQQHHVDPRGVANSAVAAFLGAGGGTGLHNQHDEPKPTHSYIGIIAMAILGSKDRKLVLSDIYQWILDHYPYFRRRGPGWRNSIRHNLSLNDCFVKVGRSANGKGHYWAVHPANVDDFERGDFRRRRAQRKVRRAMGLAVPDDDDDSPIPSPVAAEHASPHHGVHSSTTSTSAVLTVPCTAAIWPTSIFEHSNDKSPSAVHDDEPDHVSARQRQPRFIENVQDISITSGSDHLGAPLQPHNGSLSRPVFASSALFGNAVKKRRMFDVESLLAPDVVDRKRRSPVSPQEFTRAIGSADIHRIGDNDSVVNRRIYSVGNGLEHVIFQSNFHSNISFKTPDEPDGHRRSPWSNVGKVHHILNSDDVDSSQLAAMPRRTEIFGNVRSQTGQDAAASQIAISTIEDKMTQVDESAEVIVDGDAFDDELTTASTTLDSSRRQRRAAVSKTDSIGEESDVQSPKKRHDSVNDAIASGTGSRFETTTHNEVQHDASHSSLDGLERAMFRHSPDQDETFQTGDELFRSCHRQPQQHHHQHQPHQFQMQAAAVAAAWMARLKGSLLDPRVLLQLPQPMLTSSSHEPHHHSSKSLGASTSPVGSNCLVRRGSACDDLRLLDDGDVSITSQGADTRLFVDQHSGVAIKTEAV